MAASAAVFHVNCTTEFGEEVRVVGSSKSLGLWDPLQGVRLSTCPQSYPIWKSPLVIDAIAEYAEFKFVVVQQRDDGTAYVRWEDGINRTFKTQRSSAESQLRTAVVSGGFGSTSSTRVGWPQLRVMPATEKTATGKYELILPGYKTSDDPASGTLISWAQSPEHDFDMKSESSLACEVEIVGSFSCPPWAVRVPLMLCEESLTWWCILEDALPDVDSGIHQLRFLINGEVWSTSAKLAACANRHGVENNLVLIGRLTPDVGMDDGRLTPNSVSSEDATSWEVASQSSSGESISSDVADCSEWGRSLSEYSALRIFTENSLSLVAGAFSRPKNHDNGGEGEDSYFINTPSSLGVADGVGGLQSALGYNSKAFADDVMNCCHEIAQGIDPDSADSPSETAREILCQGFNSVCKYGASTAVISHLNGHLGKLGIAVLGDSGVLVVRRARRPALVDGDDVPRNSLVFKSPAQQHGFNYPYQLCRLPERLSRKLTRPLDMPTDCITFDVDVEDGDLILVCSDGVLDNLHDSEVLELCDRMVSPSYASANDSPVSSATAPEVVAYTIGMAAYRRSLDKTAQTPFADEALRSGMRVDSCCGGKADDITCVAAWVTV